MPESVYHEPLSHEEVREHMASITQTFFSEGITIVRNTFEPLLEDIGEATTGFESLALLAILSTIAAKDEKLRDEEVAFIKGMFPDVDVRKVLYHFTVNPVSIAEVKDVTTKTQRLIIFILAWQVAIADGELDASEKAYLDELMETFELDPRDVTDYKLFILSKLLR